MSENALKRISAGFLITSIGAFICPLSLAFGFQIGMWFGIFACFIGMFWALVNCFTL